MAHSRFLKYYPLIFKHLTSLDVRTGKFNSTWMACTLISCSVALATTVYKFVTKDVPYDILVNEFNNLTILVFLLSSTAIIIVKKEKVAVLIEFLSRPISLSPDAKFFHRQVLNHYVKWVNRIGVVFIFNVYLVLICTTKAFGPLLSALFVSDTTVLQELPLPFGWIPVSTESYSVYAAAYVVGAVATVNGGGLSVACYITLIYSALKIQTMLTLLTYDLASFDETVRERLARTLVRIASASSQRVRESVREAVLRDTVRVCLAELVDQHVQIMKIVHLLDNSFSNFIMLLIQVEGVCAALAITQLTMIAELTTRDVLFLVNFVFAAIFVIAVFCYCGQIIIDECENLRRALYSCSWVDKSRNFRRSVLIMLTFTVRHLYLTAGGNRPLNIETFSSCENLRRALYSCSWVDKSRIFRRSVLIMLTVTKRHLYLTAGGNRPLNMETFSSMMQTAYSYINLLLTMKKKHR